MQPAVIDFNLLRKAYGVVSKIDDSKLELLDWGCGTVACAAGHIACDKEFNDLGFRLEPCITESAILTVRYRPQTDDREYGRAATSWAAVQGIFKTDYDTAHNLFQSRYIGEEWDYNAIPEEVEIWITNDMTCYDALTDKQLWMSRVRAFFLKHNEPIDL